MKTWDDQPDCLTGALVLSKFHLKHVTIEVRETATGQFYVTVGTVFHSQTILCRDARIVLRVIHETANKRAGSAIPAFAGWSIIPNARGRSNVA